MSKHAVQFLFALEIFSACSSSPVRNSDAVWNPAGQDRSVAEIAAEPPGDYLLAIDISRESVYKFWDTSQTGSTLEHRETRGPERKGKARAGSEKLSFGSDNNYDIQTLGSFSGQTVYEPASNGF